MNTLDRDGKMFSGFLWGQQAFHVSVLVDLSPPALELFTLQPVSFLPAVLMWARLHVQAHSFYQEVPGAERFSGFLGHGVILHSCS